MATSKQVQFSTAQPEIETNIHKSNVAYHTLGIAISFAKLFGYLPWYLNADGSKSNWMSQFLSHAYQGGLIGFFWFFCNIAALIVIFQTSSSHLLGTMNMLLIKATFIVVIATSAVVYGYCAIFSKCFVDMFQKWQSLDTIILSKFQKTHFIWAQVLITLSLIGFVAIGVLSIITKDNIFEDNVPWGEWNLLQVSSLIFNLFYITFVPFFKTCTATFFIFSSWFLSIAYAEVENNLRMMLATKSQTLLNTLFITRHHERIIRELVTVTHELFAIPITVMLMDTCYTICTYVYFFAVTKKMILFVDVLFVIILLVSITVAADYLNERHGNLLESVCDLDVDPDELGQPEQLQLQLLKEKLSKCSVQFTACGFFNINRTLITTIFGVVLTYLVVLVQFRREFNESFGGNSTNNCSRDN